MGMNVDIHDLSAGAFERDLSEGKRNVKFTTSKAMLGRLASYHLSRSISALTENRFAWQNWQW
jgi:hypothetical protein